MATVVPPEPSLSRRRLLTRAFPAAAATLLTATACSRPSASSDAAEPLSALVYRGPGACDGCAEAVAALLKRAPRPFTVRYVGPGEDVHLTAAGLADADVYAQPGGNDDLDGTWEELRGVAEVLRDWTRGGGRYLGFCMGGYLAGSDPGFGLLVPTRPYSPRTATAPRPLSWRRTARAGSEWSGHTRRPTPPGTRTRG